jgi:copper homeostasis protein
MNPTIKNQILIEVCVDSIASAIAAERGGADRVELCSDLMEGGVTPSAGLIEAVRSRISIPLHTIIRPRAGDFCYSNDELEVMQRDIQVARNAGANGVVFGILDSSGRVDVPRTRRLVDLARPLSVTFHRAFDMSSDLPLALEDVCASGADRILTSGGEQTSLQGLDNIARLVRAGAGRVIVMAGGGIRRHNAANIVARTGVAEIHVGLGTPMSTPAILQNPRISLRKDSGGDYHRFQVLEADVRELRQAIAEVKQNSAPENSRR